MQHLHRARLKAWKSSQAAQRAIEIWSKECRQRHPKEEQAISLAADLRTCGTLVHPGYVYAGPLSATLAMEKQTVCWRRAVTLAAKANRIRAVGLSGRRILDHSSVMALLMQGDPIEQPAPCAPMDVLWYPGVEQRETGRDGDGHESSTSECSVISEDGV